MKKPIWGEASAFLQLCRMFLIEGTTVFSKPLRLWRGAERAQRLAVAVRMPVLFFFLAPWWVEKETNLTTPKVSV